MIKINNSVKIMARFLYSASFFILLGAKLRKLMIFSFIIFLFLVPFISAQNLLNDDGFEESDPYGIPPNSGYWSVENYPTQSGAIVTTTAPRSGSNGLWTYTASTTVNGWASARQELSAQPGDIYYAEGYIRHASGNGWATGSTAFVRVQFVNTNWWNVLATYDSNKMTTANPSWAKYSLTTGSAPTGTTKVIVRTYVQKPTTTTLQQSVVNFDDLYLDKTGTSECITNDDCDHLDNDYCSGDLIKHDEGKCISNVCETETTTTQDCNALNNNYCDKTEIKHDDYTCSSAFCVLDQTTTTQECNDGLYCNGQETCSNAACVTGTPINCDDEIICTSDSCNEATDSCDNTLNNDLCDDTNICTDDICNPSAGCQYTNNNNSCDDNLFCTVNDQCSGGLCSGFTRDCSENNLGEIAVCNNNPDNNPFTWDFRDSFTSICNEETESCTTGTEEITHTCSISQCNAECETDDDCDESICLAGCICSSLIEKDLLFYESFESLSSVIEKNGTITGTPTIVDGVLGNAINFSGSKKACYPIPNNVNNTNGTIEFWVKAPAGNGYGFFDIGKLGVANSWGIYKNANYLIMEVKNNMNSYDQAWSPNPWFDDGKWHFVSAVWETDNMNRTYFKVFLDGEGKSSYDGYKINSFPNMSKEFCLGWCGWYGYSESIMDEVKIYNYAKSNQEIIDDYLSYPDPNANNTRKLCIRDKLDSTGPVVVNCSGLYVNNKPFTIKGVGYQPIPIGMTADIEGGSDVIFNTHGIYNRDFPLLRDMNANTIRTWGKVVNESFLDAAWNNGNDPIYVGMGFWMDCTLDYSSASVRQTYIDDFTDYVNAYKDHPAVLMWLLGNEANICLGSSSVDDYYDLANELAKIAYEIEGPSYHPVGIVNWDIFHIGLEVYNSDDQYQNYTDFWGSNVYPEETFGTWFEDYTYLSGKPLLITEYGIDALNNTNKQEYEDVQAEWVLRQWKEINDSDITIGSILMAYSDEWWKAGSPSSHDYGGYSILQHPDGYSNEEWWGVMRTVDNGANPDIMQPRQVYYDLKAVWAEESPEGCTVPYNNMIIIDDTTFCRGVYALPNGIKINADSITLDCNGSTLKGNDDWTSIGINATDAEYISIKNCILKNYSYAFHAERLNSSTIQKSTFLDNYNGIYIEDSDNVNILLNNLSNNYDGIFLRDLTNSIIELNWLHGSLWNGLYLDRNSDNNTIRNNTAYSNQNHGIYLMVRGKNNISYNNVSNSSSGITLGYTENTTISHNNIKDNDYGIYLYDYSKNNKISYNNIHNNTQFGIRSEYSNQSTINLNSIKNNKYGISLVFGYGNIMNFNEIQLNENGISSYHSSNNEIIGNIFNNNWTGISLEHNSNNNIISNNIVEGNDLAGIFIADSSHNLLSNNNLKNNKHSGFFFVDDSWSNRIINNTANSNLKGVHFSAGPKIPKDNFFLSNKFCNNSDYDIYNVPNNNTGYENTCDKVFDWNDTGTTGCTYSCSTEINLTYCLEDSEDNAYLHINEQMDRFHTSFDVYTDSSAGGNHFTHMAQMDNENSLVYIYDSWRDNCYNSITCIKNEFVANISNRGGWYFQNGILLDDMTMPAENWGNYSEAGFNLTGATEVEFWARGENGGEKIEFFVFGVGRDPEWGTILQPYPDSSPRMPSIGNYITLSNEWEKYTINISSADKSYVIGGFAWYATSSNNPDGAVFYLDDIKYNYPRLDDPRFIVSYETVNSDLDFDMVLKNFAYVYDNALATIAYIARGTEDDIRRAKILADAIVYAQENDRYYKDGRIRNAYKAGDLILFPGWTPNNKTGTVSMPGWWDNAGENWYEDNFTVSTHTGNVAWAMLALLEYYAKDNNEKYLNSTIRLGEWIYENTYDLRGTGGYTGGYEGWEPNQSKIMWKSTEHNLDVYVVFMRLYEITNNQKWKDRAMHAKSFVKSMWDKDNHHFWTGTLLDGATINKDTIPADVQSWALMVTGNVEKYHGGMIFIRENCFVDASAETGFIGFDFNNDKDGIWWEGTGHNVVAFQIKDETDKSDTYLTELCKAQILATENNGKGIVAADRNNVSTGFDWEYFNRLHIGSTAWYILGKRQFNPYWGISTSETIPWSEEWLESTKISIQKGWNLFSLTLNPTDQNTDRNISLNKGWNLFGYSAETPFNWSQALINNGTLTKPLQDASDWIQQTIYYFEDGNYKLVPGNEDYLTKNKGYWLYGLEDDLTLILPGVDGSLANISYYWLNATIDNGTNITSITEAQSLNWIQSTIYYYDNGYKFVPGDDDYIYPWKGYWLYSNHNLTLIIDN
jgi:parallel beta-helix repeat protein